MKILQILNVIRTVKIRVYDAFTLMQMHNNFDKYQTKY